MQSSHSPSPISVSSSDSRHPALVLCDVHGEPLDLADLYCQQRQLAICSAPPRSQSIDPMSSTTSFNASNELPCEAPLQLPPHHHNSPAPIALSPCTVQTTLQTQSDIDAPLLRSIANGLLQTIVNQEATTAVASKWYEDRVCHLEQRVLHYEDTFNHLPEGYMLNNGKITNFHIPVGDGLYQEAKWICLNDDGTVSGYHEGQGPNQGPHIIDLYASHDLGVDSPLEALPSWFRYLLTGPGGEFQILQQAVADTDNWGLARKIASLTTTSRQSPSRSNNISMILTLLGHISRPVSPASCSPAHPSELLHCKAYLGRLGRYIQGGRGIATCCIVSTFAPHHWKMSRDVRGHPS
jgi:hypothetical protein